MRKQSLHNPICICCNTNRCNDKRNIFCCECKKFIQVKLHLSSTFISRKLNNDVILSVKCRKSLFRGKCSFCQNIAMVSYINYENKKRYFICKEHYNRWLKIGCELGELANAL